MVPEMQIYVQSYISHPTKFMRHMIATRIAPKDNIVATDFSIEDWDKVVSAAKSRAASIYTALKLAQPKLDNQKLVLQFRFPLHQKKLNQGKNKELVSQLIKEISGQDIAVECIVNKDLERHQTSVAEVSDEDTAVSSISSIFGSAEMIES